jgi:hypothetical protein
MVRKYIAGTKSDFDATYKRLLKRLYPLLSKALCDLLTFQSLLVENILYIHPVNAPVQSAPSWFKKSISRMSPYIDSFRGFQKSHQTRTEVGHQNKSEEESQ